MNQPPHTHKTGSELRFPSAASLRAAHEDLIKWRRADGDTPEVLAEIQAFIEHGCETGRLLDGEDERRASQALLDFWSNVLLRLGQDPGDATLDDFDPLLAPELPDALCPYVGLDAFSEGKTGLFFGRHRMVHTLMEKLESSRLLVVSGPSGSGKSSVVLAGLIPAFKNGALPGSEDWRYIPRMVPGSDPLANLARLLWTIGGDAETDQDTWIKDQIDQLRRDPGHLARLANESGETPVIGVIDQFEEVFTLCTDSDARLAFVANLLNLVQAPGSRHTVVLTVRTDFESFVVLLPNFQSAFDQAVIRMTPLNAAELREAIEQPAALVGLKFESGLVDALLHDILGEPAALPLLQFTLLKLWDNRQRNLITWEAYKRLGGGRLALANSANAFYDGLIPEDKVTAQRILLRLVRPTEGLEVTSNRVRLETLLQIGEARDRLERVLEKFFAARMLRVTEGDVAADTQVEIAHEALIRNWRRLVEWLDAERDRMRKRMRLTAAAEQWNSLGRTDDALWRGALLDEARQHHDLNDLEKEFVEASLHSQTEAALVAERAREREIEQAKALAEAERLRAEEQRKAASRYRRFTAALAVVSIIALVAALIAFFLAQSASEQRENAVTARKTAEARLKVAEDSLGGQLDLVNQLEIVQAENAAQAVMIQTFLGNDTGTGELRSGDGNAPQAVMIQTLDALSNRTRVPPILSAATPFPTATQAGTTLVGTPNATPTRTPTPRSTDIPTPTVLPPSSPGATTTAAALAALRSQVQATQTALAYQTVVPTPDLYAIVPGILVEVFSKPSIDSPIVRMAQPNERLPVTGVGDSPWVQVSMKDGVTGWMIGQWLTFEGDRSLLPPEIGIRVVSDRDDLPFVRGIVVSHNGTQKAYPLLYNPRDTSRVVEEIRGGVPVGTDVIVLLMAPGVENYGSGQWYFVTLDDPFGRNYMWNGYLPVEAVAER